ncbi:DUF2254 domain-containing protein [Pseudomonas benzenivorans]|uniref:DUF2254 domain-containing protein n=1 Tax=Pseudomonas benzenivorans TaxID=556533 RepID=A0ABY5H7E1_9PSED|nr:DUF2254 domain-containing protein [Pseudomonas benzenivorans]UTW08048.1 DUF2254 domain-containing protein [Pseudomonas benzenivorans]
MIQPANLLFRAYLRTIHSLAFYPTLISLGFLLVCLLNIAVEYQPWLMSLKAHLDIGLVRNADNARLILGTLVAGVMSLMVFSFSMVMVVLNNASAALSPRVVPGLISSKGHQKTLGFYLGTILYALLLITTIEQNNSNQVPSLGVLVTLGLGIACLGLFVDFIRSISLSIQVEHILNNLFATTLDKLDGNAKKLLECQDSPSWPADDSWSSVNAQRSGYFKELNVATLNELLEANDLRMAVLVHRGFFVMAGHPLFKLDRDVDEQLCEQLRDCFHFFVEQYASSHYVFGCKHISEIAVKALSPGINDPGTAITAIDMLTVLFSKRMALPDLDVSPRPDGPPRLFFFELPLDQLLQLLFGPLRTYGCEDPQVLTHLLQAFKNLLYQGPRAHHQTDLIRHARSVVETADSHILNRRDREEINAMIERFNRAAKAAPPALRPLKIDQD